MGPRASMKKGVGRWGAMEASKGEPSKWFVEDQPAALPLEAIQKEEQLEKERAEREEALRIVREAEERERRRIRNAKNRERKKAKATAKVLE